MRQSWSTRPGRTGIYSTRGSRRGLRNARSRQVGVEKVNEQEGAWAWAWAVGLRGVVVGRRRVCLKRQARRGLVSRYGSCERGLLA